VNSLLHPVGYDDTEDVEGEFDSDELSSRGVFCRFGRPDRDDSVEYSRAPTIDESSADHPSVILSAALEARSDDTPSRTQGDRPDPPDPLTDPSADESADQGTEIVDADNTALTEGIGDLGVTVGCINVPKLHGVDVVLGIVDTAHHTPASLQPMVHRSVWRGSGKGHSLVIAEEEDTETGDTVDSDEQASLRQSMSDIVL